MVRAVGTATVLASCLLSFTKPLAEKGFTFVKIILMNHSKSFKIIQNHSKSIQNHSKSLLSSLLHQTSGRKRFHIHQNHSHQKEILKILAYYHHHPSSFEIHELSRPFLGIQYHHHLHHHYRFIILNKS